jgi:hypothetical protein
VEISVKGLSTHIPGELFSPPSQHNNQLWFGGISLAEHGDSTGRALRTREESWKIRRRKGELELSLKNTPPAKQTDQARMSITLVIASIADVLSLHKPISFHSELSPRRKRRRERNKDYSGLFLSTDRRGPRASSLGLSDLSREDSSSTDGDN